MNIRDKSYIFVLLLQVMAIILTKMADMPIMFFVNLAGFVILGLTWVLERGLK